MSNPVTEINLLLNADHTVSGIIQEIEGQQFLLATPNGLQRVPVVDGFQVGDSVTYKNGQLFKEVNGGDKLRTVWV